jgi:hypothetical protein
MADFLCKRVAPAEIIENPGIDAILVEKVSDAIQSLLHAHVVEVIHW